MAVTLKEVALAAGVSVAAVSKVLHGRGSNVRVSPERAVVIKEIATTLQYRPNALARNLRSSRTHTIGLIFEGLYGIASGPLYYMHLLDGIGTEIFRRHYRLTILPELAHDDVLNALGDGQLDGVIWCKLARDERTMSLIHDCPVPIVALNAPAPNTPGDAVFVSCDNEGGIELAVEHLWSQGHRKILFLREHKQEDIPDQMARHAGFVQAIERRGVVVEPEDVATWHWEMTDTKAWWDTKPPHTAIIAWSERAAGKLLERFEKAGIRCPDDLSVIGFDSTQYCETTTPRMTAISQPISEMATHASRILLSLVAGERPELFSYVFPCGLDVRDSTGRPRLTEEGNHV